MAKGILKDKKCVNMRVKGSLGSSTKKKNNNTKWEKFKKRNKRANSWASDSFLPFYDIRERMFGLPKEKMKVYTIFSLLNIKWWISPVMEDRFQAYHM